MFPGCGAYKDIKRHVWSSLCKGQAGVPGSGLHMEGENNSEAHTRSELTNT